MAAPQPKQKDRLLELTTPLGTDTLVINGMSGSEALSSLFCFNMELFGPYEESDVLTLIGKPFSVSLRTNQEPPNPDKRYFHGILRKISRKKGLRRGSFGHWQYHAEVVPWLWLLTQRANCRIFQDLTVPKILTTIFDEYKSAFSDVVEYQDLTTGDRHLPLDYCVQYRETDFNFVSRLMEQEGIVFIFEHKEDGHKLIFTDDVGHLPFIPGKVDVLFLPEEGYADREDAITEWEHEWNVGPGKYTLRDHHFELPDDPLEASEEASLDKAEKFLEIYDYPGEFTARFNKQGERLDKVAKEGEKLVGVRIQEEHNAAIGRGGTSTCRNFCAGHLFKYTPPAHWDMGIGGEDLLLSVNFSVAQSPDYVSGEEPAAPYHNTFTCWQGDPYASNHFRTRRLTPKPVIAGPQTATVTVKEGEESWLDKFGRVRVKFHWDRDKKKDETCSCWVRVAQPWAGAGWGAHFWPRVGQEVVVEFLEGDPDRPIITGSVYNPSTPPPYKLPDNYTRSGIITRSSKDGESKNFNEIRFEDKTGKEQLFVNAERDMDQRTEHTMREWVGASQHLIVQGTQLQAIGGNKHETIKGDHIEKIDGDASRQLKGDHLEKITGNHNFDVEGDSREQVAGKISLMTSNHHEKVKELYVLESGQEIHLKGNMKVIIESDMQVSLKGPGGFVDINTQGVTIQGTLVMINSGGAAGSGSGVDIDGPEDPKDPNWPQTADDGSKGGAMG